MKGSYVFTTGHPENIVKIIKQGRLTRRVKGKTLYPLNKQPPKFKDLPLIFTSFYAEGYNTAYHDKGIIFTTKQKPIYACPSDAFSLMRNGSYLRGHEKFLFNSIDEMLEKYPTSIDFKRDFKKFFNELDAEEIFSSLDKKDAIIKKNVDYVNTQRWFTYTDYNEICFADPVEIEVIAEFQSHEELKEIMGF